MSKFSVYTASVLVTSDRCFSGVATDESGPLVVAKLSKLGFRKVNKIIVQDNEEAIANWLIKLCNRPKKALIITVGGTGLCPNDVTPDATKNVLHRTVHGLAIALLVQSLQKTPFAALSRLVAGVRKNTLIVNFPGNSKACAECWPVLKPLLHHIIHQINYDRASIDAFHKNQLESIMIDIPRSVHGDSRHPENNNKQVMDHLTSIAIVGTPSEVTLVPSTNNCLQSTTSIEKRKIADLDTYPNNLSETGDGDIQMGEQYLRSRVPLIDSERSRTSKYPMIDYYNAISILYEKSTSLYSRSVTFPIKDYDLAKRLIGQTLANEHKTRRVIPSHRVSTMDGFLVNIPPGLSESFDRIVSIEAHVLGDSKIFQKKKIKKPESFFCYPINTGDRIPHDDCVVVPIEKTGPSKGGIISIYELKKDAYIREIGSDLPSNFSLNAGTVIGPVELSLICSMGLSQVEIIRKPTISIMSTGDELSDPFESSSFESVIDTNGPLLVTFFANKGFEINNCGIVKDDCDRLLAAMTSALIKTDILVISGGASMGTKDFVKDIIEIDLAGTIHFGRVNIKPGKPVGFATCQFQGKDKFIFCLPGNPVSAFITSLVIVMPFLHRCIQLVSTEARLIEPTCINDWTKVFNSVITKLVSIEEEDEEYQLENRMEFIRARIISRERSKYLVSVSIKQQSSRLLSLQGCDCLLVISPGTSGRVLEVGKKYPAFML